ncbi:MAG: serine/threonine protein kinase [Muribaculaceae bacterium]|nr:serine/threonine protein kinase [Muribaculaceae bacterium]
MSEIKHIFEKGEPFDGRYKLVELLSTAGGSADVWLAIDLNTIEAADDEAKAIKVVIKIYRPKNMIDMEGEYQFRKEFKKVFGCHHENIIQPTYFSVFEELPYLVLPYCPAGSSESLIGRLHNVKDLWKYIYEVASGMAYLHDHTPQIIHQDIKPANVLIDDNGNYAITDFGISAEMGGVDMELEEESGGTFAYMAPERFISGTPPMPESDIWAFGATLYELVTGDVPYGNDGGSKQKKGISVPPIKNKIPESIKKLIYSCLSYNAKDRPTARQIAEKVLRMRYVRYKKTFVIIISCVVMFGVGITFYFTSRESPNPDTHLDSLYESADSIISAQIRNLERSNSVPSAENISELKEATVLLNKILKDAPASYSKKKKAHMKVKTIDELTREAAEYDYTNRLVENAQITEMEDSVMKYSLVRDNIRIRINNLTQQLK